MKKIYETPDVEHISFRPDADLMSGSGSGSTDEQLSNETGGGFRPFGLDLDLGK